MRSFGFPSIAALALSLLSTTSAVPVPQYSPEHQEPSTKSQSYPHPTGEPHQSWPPVPSQTASWSSAAPPQASATAAASSAQAAIVQDFPDPTFIKTSNGYYAFGTSSAGHNIQIAHSSNFATSPSWTVLNQDALPNPGSWTDNSHNIWAPYVVQLPSGQYLMYYSAPPSSDNSKHCIGTATSSSVTGPYSPSSSAWVCPLSSGGAIDATFFRDPKSGNAYVAYKIDGNSLDGDGTNHATPIMLQQVNANDGVTKIGNPVQILDRNDSDGPLVEAPAMYYANGYYFLLFSTGVYSSDNYDIRYVSSTSVTGPYSSTQTKLLYTNDGHGVRAPGSCDVHQDGSIMFHGTVASGPVRDTYAGYVQASGASLKFSRFA